MNSLLIFRGNCVPRFQRINSRCKIGTSVLVQMSKRSKAKSMVDGSGSGAAKSDASFPVSTGKSGQVEIKIQATPGAKHNSVLGIEERVRVSVAAQATDGKANKELLLYLAEVCGVKKSQIDLAAGHKSREKVVYVSDSSVDGIMQKLRDAID